ncbi:hypothetical protein [Pseudomonas sp. WMBT8]|uniref:hypothetical protein n=1 Tax=Pseudomonas sp. WMBT8 TaxID=3414496 RepID=UPI003D805979
MLHDFTSLKLALQDPAYGPYALSKMRELLIQGLERSWPSEAYAVTNLLLPWSGKISDQSRSDIAWLIAQLEKDPNYGNDGLSNLVVLMQTISR